MMKGTSDDEQCSDDLLADNDRSLNGTIVLGRKTIEVAFNKVAPMSTWKVPHVGQSAARTPAPFRVGSGV